MFKPKVGTPPTNGRLHRETDEAEDSRDRSMTFSPTSRNSLSVITRSFTVARSPSEDFPYTNCLGVHRSDFPSDLVHVLINNTFPLTIRYDNDGELEPGCLGVSLAQRHWMGLSEGARVTVVTLPLESALPVREMEIQLEFLKRGYQNPEPYLADDMIMNFTNEYRGILMTDHQPILFKHHGEKLKGTITSLVVGPPGSPPLGTTGIVTERTHITFIGVPDSAIGIIPSTKQDRSLALRPQIFTAEHLGIGGLDTQFDYIRRVLASYELTTVTADELGTRHVKGILLYGPPGTGKALFARQIGKVLHAWEPKSVNCHDLVGKSVSTTEDVIRSLFSDAENEYQTSGRTSRLHIIVINHLDAIVKRRSSADNGSEGDNVISQLLSKVDTSTPNILLIGTANDLGAIDGTLSRPGRFDVHLEIPLPNESGRYQILNIHTSHMRLKGIIDGDVDLHEIASLTANFSGAEISNLIRCATSFAFNRHLKVTMSDVPANQDLRVKREDLVHALQEVRPAFGVSVEELQNAIQNDIIPYDGVVKETLKSAKLVVEQVRTSTWTTSSSILLYGPSGSGKTALAASIARSSGYPFVRFLSADNMIGYTEAERIAEITKTFADSQNSSLSVIVVDDIERLIDWAPKSGTYSNPVLQTLLVLFRRRLPKSRRLLTIATSSTTILSDLGFPKTFHSELLVPPISSLAPVDKVLSEMALFSSDQEKQRAINMIDKRKVFPKSRIGIKDLLNVIEMARQERNNIAERLVASLLKWKESGK